MTIEVVRRGFWSFGGGIMEDQKLWGQITECRVDGVLCYVRENTDSSGSFVDVSSNERWRFKGGNDGKGRPSMRHQILELCCPDPDRFDELALTIRAADPRKRPVLRNRTWTVEAAKRFLRDGRHGYKISEQNTRIPS